MVTHTMMPILVSDHLLEALAALNRAREKMRGERVTHPEAVLLETTSAELSIARAIGLIAGCPEG